MRTTIKARLCYLDFRARSPAPIAVRMMHAFEAQGIRFRPFTAADVEAGKEPAPLPPYRMTKSCDGTHLYIEQEQEAAP